MTNFKLLALGALIASSATLVQAEDSFSLGAGVGVLESPYKDYDRDVVPVPVINYESDSFWFRGLGAGYYLWNDEADKLSLTAYYSPLHFKPGDSDDAQLKRLDKRKSTLMAGLSYIHNTQYGFLRTTLSGDTLDNSNGIVWDLAWLYRYTNGNLMITPGIGIEWNSENQNDYYYGVSRKESNRSGLARYRADDSWNPYLELTAAYRLSDNWNVYGLARYTRLADEVTDSPMEDQSWGAAMSAGITYRF